MRLCFTTDLGRGQQIQSMRRDASSVSGLSSFLKSQKSVPCVSYPLGSDAILDVDGAVRESACEAMFEQDEDCLSVSTAVLDALLASPVDTRRPLARYANGFVGQNFYRVVHQVVHYLLLTSKQKLCRSISSIY